MPYQRTDLPTVSDDEIEAAFDRDITDYGIPVDTRLLGRNLIALNSFGLEDFAFAKLTSLPKELHRSPWYWEAARFLCLSQPQFNSTHRAQLLAEAEQLHDDGLTAEFRAHALYANGDTDGALRVLESIPPGQLGNYAAELLLKIYVARHDPRALALAQRVDCFDLRNGHHWQLLAQAEEEAGHSDAASRAWQKAIFYCPDDPCLIIDATNFAAKHNDPTLLQAINATQTVYGQRVPFSPSTPSF
jgi:tetratricopeptide (TPR) repeat protein